MQLIFSGDTPGQVWLVDGIEVEPVNNTALMKYYQGQGIAGPVEINYEHWRLLHDRWLRTIAAVDPAQLAKAIADVLPDAPTADQIAEAVRARLAGALEA